LETREARRELAYEALLACGRTAWSVGDKVRVYRTQSGAGGVVDEDVADKRDYDVERYARLLRDTFVSRLARAFTAEDFGVVFAEPGQMSLFGKDVGAVRAVLMRVGEFGG
jgi:hypothetical protein